MTKPTLGSVWTRREGHRSGIIAYADYDPQRSILVPVEIRTSDVLTVVGERFYIDKAHVEYNAVLLNGQVVYVNSSEFNGNSLVEVEL